MNEGRLVALGEMKRRANERGLDEDIHYYNVGMVCTGEK